MTPEQLKQIYFSFYETHQFCDDMKRMYIEHPNDSVLSTGIPPKNLPEALLGFLWHKHKLGSIFWSNIYYR